MTETAHQVLDRRAGGSGQRLAGMPQVMEAESRHARRNTSPAEGLADRIPAHRPTVTPDEDPIRPGPLSHVRSQNREDVRRHHHGPLARVRLGLGIERGPAALQQFDAVPPDGNGARRQVHVVSTQPQHLTAAQTAPGSQEHGSAIPRGNGLDQRDDLGGRAIGRSFARSAPAPAMLHGFFTIAPSLTAVFITARRNR